jgi:osmotically-inducible protein OsmY
MAATTAVDDTLILAGIIARLSCEPKINVDRYDISIASDNGLITISGKVDDIIAKRLIPRYARIQDGVRMVIDDLMTAVANPMSDKEIVKHITDAFIFDPYIDAAVLDVAADSQGRVILTGKVRSWAVYRLCEVLSWWVPGVSSVNNLIEIDPPPQCSDGELRENIISILEKDILVNRSRISVSVENSVVTLKGWVPASLERNAAEKDCWYTPGVDYVKNEIVSEKTD